MRFGSKTRRVSALHDVLGKEVRGVRQRLELEAVARQVFEEHCVLLTGCTGEAQVGFNDERHLGTLQLTRKLVERGDREAHAKVRHGHLRVGGEIAG